MVEAPEAVPEFSLPLQRLLGRAALINERSPEGREKGLDYSFTSILAAFFISDDPFCLAFQSYVKKAGISVEPLLKRKGFEGSLEEVARYASPETVHDPSRSMTDSARKLFSEAAHLFDAARGRGREVSLDVQHLMGAYVYRDVGHGAELRKWGFVKKDWSVAFLTQVRDTVPYELDHWKKLHLDHFEEEPDLPSVGLSTHIASDLWTVEDALGYDAYAYAIYRFIADPETRAPLTISIQAPWGGGKTSLMRMIQKYLDPEAAYRSTGSGRDGERSGEEDSDGEMKIGDVREEFDRRAGGKPPQAPISVAADKPIKRLTVWFNAWKYESTEQVWAGLADAIVSEVTHRLEPKNRQRFWFRLHLPRLDVEDLNRSIRERIALAWRRRMRPWLLKLLPIVVGSVALALVGQATEYALHLESAGLGVVVASVLVGVRKALTELKSTRSAVEEEPARLSLGEYLRVPDYSKHLGFVHRVEDDLRRVFEIIPEKFKPLVVFIDDLDRCSPDRVADVFEAVNLFLAGQFQECIFVLGIDPDMVAASLEVAHEKLISKLPADATATPIGWRFMDKFVQLPFGIPPPENNELEEYARSLLTERTRPTGLDQKVEQVWREDLSELESPSEIESALADVPQRYSLNTEQQRDLALLTRRRVTLLTMDQDIDRFSDRHSEIRNLVLETAPQFSHNPRELKRFINMYRFLYFLRSAERARGGPAPSKDQLRRWIVLALRWPEVVRWCRRSYGGRREEAESGAAEATGRGSTGARLRQLEGLAAGCSDLATWLERARKDLRLDPEKTAWIADPDLMRFFQAELQIDGGERLSSGSGMGLW